MKAPSTARGGASGAPSDGEPAVEADASKLSAFGERFMQMFDDYDEVKAASRGHRASSSQQKGGPKPASAPSTSAAKQQQHAAGHHHPLGAALHAQQQDTDATQPQRPRKQSKRPRSTAGDEIEEILQAHLKRPLQHTKQAAPPQPGVQVVDQTQIYSAAGASRLSTDVKAARRAFMSHKATKVHSIPVGQDAVLDGKPLSLDPSLSPEEFKQMALQIERLGGAALDDKRQRKQWKAQFLERLGAKPERLPRMAAKMGVGVAKKRAQRDARALAEAIASGTVRVKGMGKKKAAEKAAVKRDAGLQEAGPGFKNGILRVRDPSKPQKAPKRTKGGKR